MAFLTHGFCTTRISWFTVSGCWNCPCYMYMYIYLIYMYNVGTQQKAIYTGIVVLLWAPQVCKIGRSSHRTEVETHPHCVHSVWREEWDICTVRGGKQHTLILTHMHARTHTHTYTYTHAHTCIHTGMYVYVHTHMDACTRTHTFIHSHTLQG